MKRRLSILSLAPGGWNVLDVGLSSMLFFFFGPHLHHVEVPRLVVESELQLPAYITAMWDPTHSNVGS